MPEWLRERNTDKKVHVENSNSQNVNYTITSCQRGTSQGSYRIFFEDGSSFFLSVDFFIEHKLRKGLQIEQGLFELIKEESLFVEAYIKALNLLSRQLYSSFNLKRKLQAKQYESNAIERTIDALKDSGRLDDEYFARQWVESRIRSKLDSSIGLIAGLMRKGISGNISKIVVREKYTQEVEYSIISKSIIKYRRQGKCSDAIIRNLLNKGFNLNKVNSIFKDQECL